MTKITRKTTFLTLILTFFLAIVAIFAITPNKKSLKASAAGVTTISGVMIGPWCAERCTDYQIWIDATSGTVPTKTQNWNAQLGISGVNSMYGSSDGKFFVIDLSHKAISGTAITIPTTQFTVDGVSYQFDQEYTFYYNGTSWGTDCVAPPANDVRVLSGVSVAADKEQTNMKAFLTVESGNLPRVVTNWTSQMGMSNVTSMYPDALTWIVIERSRPASIGTKMTIPATTFTIDGVQYKFDKAYDIYFNGTTWTMDFVATPEFIMLSGLAIHPERLGNDSHAYIKVASQNVPEMTKNWNEELGVRKISSMYPGGYDWFACDFTTPVFEGSKLVLPADKTFTVQGQKYQFDQEYTFYFNGTHWTADFVENPYGAEIISGITRSTWCINNSTPTLLYVNALSENAPTGDNWNDQLKIDGVSSIYTNDGKLIEIQLSEEPIIGTEITIPATVFTSNGEAYKFYKAYTYYFDGEKWGSDFVAFKEEMTLGAIKGNSSANTIYVESSNIPVKVTNWIWDLPESAAFRSSITLTGTSNSVAQLSIYSESKDILIITGLNAVAGTHIKINGGVKITIGDQQRMFYQSYEFWFNGTTWQTPLNLTFKGLGTTNNQDGVSIEFNETVPAEVDTVGNLSFYGGGTLGKNATWKKDVTSDEVKFNGAPSTGVLKSGNGIVMYPPSKQSQAGAKIVIPAGTVLLSTVNNYVVISETITLWYDGTEWSLEEYQLGNNMVLGDILATSTAKSLKIKAANVPVIVLNWIWNVPEAATFRNSITLKGTNKAVAELSIFSASDGVLQIDGANAVAGTYLKINGGCLITINGNQRQFDKTYEFWFNGTTWQTEPYCLETNLTFKGIGATNGQNGVVIEFNETLPEEVDTVGNLSFYGGGTFGANATWSASFNATAYAFNYSGAYSTGVLVSGNGIVMYPPSGQSGFGAKIVIPAGTTLISTAYNLVTITETITLWYDGTAWSTTQPTLMMSLGDIQGISIANTIYVDAVNVPVVVQNWIYAWPESATFKNAIKLTATDASISGLSLYSDTAGRFIITNVYAIDGTYIKIPGGITLTVNGIKCQFDKDYEFTYAFGQWHVGKKFIVTQSVDGETTAVIADSEYVLPEVSMENGVAFGWLYGENLYGFGDTITLTENVTITAQSINFVQKDGASIRLTGSADRSGIRFTCFLTAEDFEKYKDLIVSIGIEVQPLDLMNSDYTINESNKPVIFSITKQDNELYVENDAEFGEGVLLRGTIQKMYTHNFNRPIAARSYIEMNLNGQTYKLYYAFDINEHVRAISDIAKAYKEDKGIVGDEVLNAYIGEDDLITYAYFAPTPSAENYAAYKAAGFDTLWLNTADAVYCYQEPFQTTAEALAAANTFANSNNQYKTKTYMDMALAAGIKKVIVYDNRIRLLTQCDVALVSNSTAPIGIFTSAGQVMGSQINQSKFNKSANTYNGVAILDILYPFSSREALKEYIAACLASYMNHEAFYGVFLVDEPSTDMYAQVGLVRQILKEICPDIYMQSSQLPPINGKTVATWENELRAYLDACGGVGNVSDFSYDMYPCHKSGIEANYIQAMQVAAEIANEYGCDWELVFQTYANTYYQQLNQARVLWQTNLATAFGVDKLSAYSYADSTDGGIMQNIERDANLKGWVKTALGYAEHTTAALTNYSYNASQTYNASEAFLTNVTNKEFSGNVFTSISSTGAMLVNELAYEGSKKYAYAFVNCTNVINGNTQITVTVNFAKETTLKFVYNGTTVEKTFTVGANTFTLNAGEMAIIK